MQPESNEERARRHAANVEAYRALVDPANPPRKPFLFEHHFFCDDDADVTGLVQTLEDRGFGIETFAYDPDSATRTWTVVAVKIDLLEERRVLALSDEMDALARSHGVTYDGWLTRVEEQDQSGGV